MTEPSEIAALAANYVNTTNRHIFLTGKAGTGKTTFLKYIIQHTYKNTVVAAPTGIAAINAGGVTLHSLFQLPFGSFIPNHGVLPDVGIQINTPVTLGKHHKFNASKRQMLQEMELLIIDEVSMLRADLLDCIDATLRKVRRNQQAFGGIQLLFIGDLMQLPPVVKEQEWNVLRPYYDNVYFFNALALKDHQPIKVELQKIYRQSNQDFIDLLNRFRFNQQTTEDFELLNRCYQEGVADQSMPGYIHLTTHNHNADQINEQKLNDLPSSSYYFQADISGDFPESMYPIPAELELKDGAQVMFVKNDPTGQQKFFNGKIGTISGLSKSDIKVRFEDGDEVFVEKYNWENKRFVLNKDTKEIDEKHIGQFEQYPIKLAWAVTVHKSQGLTFDKAILDLQGTFAPGQMYVALSRLTALDGLVLSSKLPNSAPGIDNALVAFTNSFEQEAEIATRLNSDRKTFIFQFVQQAFDLKPLAQELEFHIRGFDKDENRSVKQQYLEWHRQLLSDVNVLMDVGHKFVRQAHAIVGEEVYLQQLNDRVCKAKDYFNDSFKSFAERFTSHLSAVKKSTKTKTYQKELSELQGKFDYQIRQIIKVALLIDRTADNQILTKKDLHKDQSYSDLLKSAKSNKKASKIPTAFISFELFRQGKKVREIAKERDLTVQTVEGHLCQFVKQGKLDVQALMEMDKVDKILSKQQGRSISLSELKSELKHEFSFAELKIALAHGEMLLNDHTAP